MSGIATVMPIGGEAPGGACAADGDALEAYVARTLERSVHEGARQAVAEAYAALERDLAPGSGVERLLLAQMLVIHHRAMRGMRDGLLSEDEDVQHRRIERLMRLFLQQLEALRKYRGGGQQTITINHVHADKAVIGGLAHGGRQ